MKWFLFLPLLTIGVTTSDRISRDCPMKDDPQFETEYSKTLSEFISCYPKSFIFLANLDDDSKVEPLIGDSMASSALVELLTAKPNIKCDIIRKKINVECLSVKARNFVNSVERAYSRIREYLYDGHKIADFTLNGGLECVESVFTQCFQESKNSSRVSLYQKTCRFYGTFKPCVENIIPERCSNAAPYIYDFIDIMKSSFCSHEENSDKDILLESSKQGFLSFVPSRKRLARDIGGVGSKLPHIEQRVKFLCDSSEELDDSLTSMKTCLNAKKMFITPRDEFIEHIDTCSKETRDLLKKCLPEKLRYFPDFFFNLVESVVRLLYDDFGEIARGLSPCMPKLKQQESKDDYEDCLQRSGKNIEDSILESKATFCEKFIEASGCFIKQLNHTCTANKDLQKFEKDYMAAMERPCK